jgi:hypothetical protein
MRKRYVMPVELTEPAMKAVEGMSDHHGMTQVAIMSRLVDWFAAQEELIQSAVLGRFRALSEELIRQSDELSKRATEMLARNLERAPEKPMRSPRSPFGS